MRDFTAVLAIALTTVSCSRGVSHVKTRALPVSNPRTYSFALPLEEVRARALQAFSLEHQIEQPILGRSVPPSHLESILSAECATNAVFGAGVLADPKAKCSPDQN